MTRGVAFFDTAIGRCGLAWGEHGVIGVQLPEAITAATRARLLRRFPEAVEQEPPVQVRRAIDDIVALLRGEARDLSYVDLDVSGVPAFDRRVYDAARRIAAGETLAYGEVAAVIGLPEEARAVGQALGRNPFPIIVPCHRVVAARGALGGFSAHGGAATKVRLLEIEGAAAVGGRSLWDTP